VVIDLAAKKLNLDPAEITHDHPSELGCRQAGPFREGLPRARVHGEERHGRDAHDLVLHGDTAAATEEGGEGAADAGVGQLQLVKDHDGRLEDPVCLALELFELNALHLQD